MSVPQVNQKPIKTTKIADNGYKYEYADGTVKCVFDEKNSVTYNKKNNKDIKIQSSFGDVSVFNGKNVNVDMGKSCTGITMEKCKDSSINAQHNSINRIDLNNSTNMTIKADPEDIIYTNDTKVKHNTRESFKLNDKGYGKARKLTDADAKPQDRAKIYDKTLFNGPQSANVKMEEGYFSTGIPVGGVSYKKATFANGDVVIRTGNGQYLEYNTANNKNIKISAKANDGLEIKNANGLTFIETKMGDSGVLENSANCTYSSMNSHKNYFETVNCKNVKYDGDYDDEVKNNGHKIKK